MKISINKYSKAIKVIYIYKEDKELYKIKVIAEELKLKKVYFIFFILSLIILV